MYLNVLFPFEQSFLQFWLISLVSSSEHFKRKNDNAAFGQHRQGSKCEKLKKAGFIYQMWLKKKTSVLLLSSSSEVSVHI